MTTGPNPTAITAEAGSPFLDVVREFNAPIESLFRAHTDPEIFASWNAVGGMPLRIVEFDARVGGRWQYVAFEGTEQQFGFRGVFHTVDPTLIIHTFEFDAGPGAAGISTIRFEDVLAAGDAGSGGARTRMSMREIYPSVEVRDFAIASGMEYGIIAGHELLDQRFAADLAQASQ